MQIINAPVEKASQALANNLRQLLTEDKKVLWLVPGGSNIEVVVWVMNQLRGIEAKLTIMLTDERYGLAEHADSNWLQLAEAGFEPGQANALSTLIEGLNLSQTAENYANKLHRAFEQTDISVGFFGMGADGHTAGILPGSVAADELELLACGYHSEQFDRVTMTFPAIKKLDIAYCLAYGEAKKQSLEALISNNLPLTEQPAQILKVIPTSYVYNDQTRSEI